MISFENRSHPDLMRGVETSLPPFAMDAAAKKGRPAPASITGFPGNCACPARGPGGGECSYEL